MTIFDFYIMAPWTAKTVMLVTGFVSVYFVAFVASLGWHQAKYWLYKKYA